MTSESSIPSILVSGATGFLGKAIVDQLRHVSCRLRTTGRRMRPPTDLPNYVAADICDRSAVARLVAGNDVVIHSAGLAHQHRATSAQDAEFFRINTLGTETVVRAAAAAGCRRIVLIGSVSVYGNGWPPKTEAAACRPVGAYAQSKLEAEKVAAEVANSAGMELVVLRMATLYGRSDPGNVGRLLQAIDRRRFVWIGRGENVKSLIEVEDAASACVIAACCPNLPNARTFNVSAEPCSMRAIVAGLAEALDRRVPPLRLPPRPLRFAAAFTGKVPRLAHRAQRFRSTLDKWLSDEAYDATLFRDSFGWAPRISLHDGLARQVAAYRQARDSAGNANSQAKDVATAESHRGVAA